MNLFEGNIYVTEKAVLKLILIISNMEETETLSFTCD